MEVSFDGVLAESVSTFLNSVPTSLELEGADVDRLIVTGRLLLRHEPSFEAFKSRVGAVIAESAISDDEICRHFDAAECTVRLEQR